MKAAQINAYGGVEVLEVKDIPEPTLKKDQILAEVHAAGLNPFDVKLRSGMMKNMIPLNFPVTFGGDFSGIVTQVGEGVTEYKAGEEVYGTATVLSGGSGAYADFATVGIEKIAFKPKIASFEEAAALPVAGSSVVQAIEEHFKLQSMQKILIHGGAGGIGHMAIQLAKSIGAYVATTVNSDGMEFVKGLGADEVIDYKTQKFEMMLKDFDAVYDTVGGEVTNKSFEVLRKSLPAGRQGGILVSMLGQPNEELAKKYGVTGIGQNTQNNREHLTRLAELVDSGKIKVHVDKAFPLEQVREAFSYLETGSPRGKVVLKIKD